MTYYVSATWRTFQWLAILEDIEAPSGARLPGFRGLREQKGDAWIQGLGFRARKVRHLGMGGDKVTWRHRGHGID